MDEAADPRDRALTVQLELQLDRRPLSGRVRGRQGVEHAFVGWLGFVDALQRLGARDDSYTTTDGRPR